MNFRKSLLAATAVALLPAAAFADAHATPMVMGENQDMSGGTVSAGEIVAGENGWMVVHRTDVDMKPGVVVGYAPLKAGVNADVTALLTEEAKSGDMFMLMVHSEAGGMAPGVFEYTLGAKEDGPIRIDGDLVMAVVTAQ